jgi:FAD synthetase
MNEDPSERTERYIANVEKALTNLTWIKQPTTVTSADVTLVLDTVKRYVSDAKYYLHEGKSMTALVSISYAEGLLDAVKFLRIAEFSWQTKDI